MLGELGATKEPDKALKRRVEIGPAAHQQVEPFLDQRHERQAVLIRQLTTAQQVLSHGLPIANDELLGKDYSGVPMLRAPDGFRLHSVLSRSRAELARLRPRVPLSRLARSVEHA